MKKSRKYKKHSKNYSKKYSKKNVNKKYRKKFTKRYKYRRGGNEDDLRKLMLEHPGEDNIENILYPRPPPSFANKSTPYQNNKAGVDVISQYQSALDKGIDIIVNHNSTFFGPSKEKIKLAAREGAAASSTEKSPYLSNKTLNTAWNDGKDLRKTLNLAYGIK